MSDIKRGNEGIDLGTWTGWDGPNERPPLPQYPQPWDLPDRPPMAGNDRDRLLASVSVLVSVSAGALLLQGVVS